MTMMIMIMMSDDNHDDSYDDDGDDSEDYDGDDKRRQW
jgi:hypothetical protein